MIIQNLFNNKPKTFMDYAPGKVPRKEEWDTQTTTKTRTYDPFASNVKLVGDDMTEKDYDTFFEGFKSTNDKSLWEAPKLWNEPKTPTLPKRSLIDAKPKRKTISYNPVFGSEAKTENFPYRPSDTNETKIEFLPGRPSIEGEAKIQLLPYIPSKDGQVGFINYASNAPQNIQARNASQNSDAIEFGEDSETYKILQDLSKRWYETSDSAEKDRLHEVAEKVRMYHRQGTPIVDKHDEIMNLLHENKKTAQNYQKTMTEGFPGFLYRMSDGNYMLDSSTYLIGMVDKGDWDYKNNDDWRVKYNYFDGKDMDTPKSNYRNWLPWMYFDGHLISADKLGNMNMAYVGKNMGLPEWVYKNPTTMDKDDPYWVQYGIDLAESGR